MRSVERPWSWAIVAASFGVHFLVFGLAWSVGILNLIFLEVFDAPPAVTSWAGSLVLAVIYATSPLASVLANKYGCRPVTIVGGVLASAGLCLSTFANSIYFILGTFGVITGFGFCLTYVPAVSIVAYYFDKRRAVALGLMTSGIGFGTIVFPPLTRSLFLRYGWRGTMLLLGGGMLNICVCGALMRPIDIRGQTPENRTKLMDLTIFKNVGYLFLCANNFLVCFGLSITFVHLPAFIESRGANSMESAMLMSIVGVSNLIGRLAFGFLAQIKRLETTAMYALAFGAGGIFIALTPVCHEYTPMAVLGGLFGFLSGSFGPVLLVVITRLLGVQRISNGYALLLIFEGAGSLIGAPLAGWLFDIVHHYDVSLYIGGGAMLLASVTMIGPYLQIRSDTKRDVIDFDVMSPAEDEKCAL